MGSPGGKEDKEGKNSPEESATVSTIDSPKFIIFFLPKKPLVSFMDICLFFLYFFSFCPKYNDMSIRTYELLQQGFLSLT